MSSNTTTVTTPFAMCANFHSIYPPMINMTTASIGVDDAVTAVCFDSISPRMSTAATNMDSVLTTASSYSYSKPMQSSSLENSNNLHSIKWRDVLEETEVDFCSSTSSSGEEEDNVSRLIGDIVDFVQDGQNVCITTIANTPITEMSNISTMNNSASCIENSKAPLNLDTVDGNTYANKVTSDLSAPTALVLPLKSITKSDISAMDNEKSAINFKGNQRIQTIRQNGGTISTLAMSVETTNTSPSRFSKSFSSSVTNSVPEKDKEIANKGTGSSSLQDNQRPHEYATCGKTFFESVDLLMHGKTHTGEEVPYDCFICGSAYSTFSDLKRHQEETHSDRKSHTCPVCENSFSSPPPQVQTCAKPHTRIRQNRHHECSSYEDVYSSSIHLEDDEQTYANPHECSICGEAFSQPSHLETHMRFHSGEKSYSSQSEAFRTKPTNHHVDEKRHQCSICGKVFFAKSALMCHIRTHTGEKPFMCHICDKTFVCKSNHSKHMSVHAGEKIHQCSTCGKAFSQSRYLRIHMRIHTGEKPYECSTCGKAFAVKTAFTCHTRIHTGERPHECSICGKGFTKSTNLQTHLRRHKGEKPYMCSTCGKAFACGTSLKVHMRIHTGEKPYKCMECGKQFASSSSLYVHKRIHSGVKPFKCMTCGKAFIHKGHLQRHMEIHERARAN